MNLKKALGFGVLVWLIMFVVISALIAYNVAMPSGEFSTINVVLTILALVIVYIVTRYIAPSSSGVALQYGLVFAIVGIVLDFLISQKFAPDVFSSVFYWVGYVLIVFVPLLAVKKVSNLDQQ